MGCCDSAPPPKPVVKSTPAPEARTSSMKSYATKTEKPTQEYQVDRNPDIKNTDNMPLKTENNASNIPKEPKIESTSKTPPRSKTNESKQSNISKTKESDAKSAEVKPIIIITSDVSSFSGLYKIFTKHTMNGQSERMDINGLTSAMKIFGLKIDKDKELQKLIWSKFDLDKEKEIDFNDFMATMSSLIDVKNEDSLFLFFQMFDYDLNGFLEVDELAEMLFSQQKIAAAVTNQPGLITSHTNQECIKKAQQFVNENDDNGDGKISFDEYNKWRNEHHIATPINA